jgi:hypothetical protein
MISAKQCRVYAAECKVLASSSDISTQRSLEQSIMALNWSALADEIDIDSARAAYAAFSSNKSSHRQAAVSWWPFSCQLGKTRTV